MQQPEPWPKLAPVDFWEERYSGEDRVWSGRVNRVLADVAGGLEPGRALDLGCGEGADVIWLAEHGWDASGIDISPTAIAHATTAAKTAGLERARFLVADLSTVPAGAYDLVTASFLHSPVELPRQHILRQAADRVAPGGHLLVTSHAAFPPWSEVPDEHEHHFLTPQEELESLALGPDEWDVLLAETRPREAVGPSGEAAIMHDAIVLIRHL